YGAIGVEDADQRQLGGRNLAAAGAFSILPKGKAVSVGVVYDQKCVLPVARRDRKLAVEFRCHRVCRSQAGVGYTFIVRTTEVKRLDSAEICNRIAVVGIVA